MPSKSLFEKSPESIIDFNDFTVNENGEVVAANYAVGSLNNTFLSEGIDLEKLGYDPKEIDEAFGKPISTGFIIPVEAINDLSDGVDHVKVLLQGGDWNDNNFDRHI